MKNAFVLLIKGSGIKCGGSRIQAKAVYIIETMWDVKLADIPGTE
jgi:hypothetical protein